MAVSKGRSRFLNRVLRGRIGSVAVAVLMLVAFLLAAWSSASIFDRLPHTEDEVTFLFQAKTVAEGNLIAAGPEHKEFFYMSFVIIEDGKWFGKYPPGYPIVLSAGVLIGHPWLVNALAASVAAGLLIHIGYRFYDVRTGLVAGALMVVSPFFVIQSGSLLSHVVALCWTLLLILLVDIMRSRDMPLAAVGAGAAAGMLLLTRPLTALGLGLPFVVLAAVDVYRRRPLVRRYLLAVLGAAPFVIGLLVYNDVTTGSPLKSAYELWWSYDRIGFGPQYGINGHSLEDAIDNTRKNLGDLSMVLFGWPWRSSYLPVLLATMLGLWNVCRNGFSRRTSADLLMAGMFVGLVGVHMLYWTSGRMYGPRYYFEIIGVLSLLGARGIIWVWDEVTGVVCKCHLPAWPFRGVMLVVLVGLMVYGSWVTLPAEADRYRDWNGVNRDDLTAVQQADLENALVFAPRPNWQTYALLFLENSTTLDGSVIYAVDRGDEHNSVLMRDFPDRHYYRYRDGDISPLEPPVSESRVGAPGDLSPNSSDSDHE